MNPKLNMLKMLLDRAIKEFELLEGLPSAVPNYYEYIKEHGKIPRKSVVKDSLKMLRQLSVEFEREDLSKL